MSRKTTHEQVNDLRRKRAPLYAEYCELLRQRRSRAEVVGLLDFVIEQTKARAKELRSLDLRRLAFGGNRPALFDLLGFHGTEFSADIGALVVSLVGGEKVRATWLETIDEIPEGLSASEKAKRLAVITRELDRLEAEEERLIVQSEQEGEPIARRADARPEIILAPAGSIA
jgi:hypothetical protein